MKSKIAYVLALVSTLSAASGVMVGTPDAMARSKAPHIEVVRGEFDHYVLAVSYQKDFCLTHPNKVECKSDDILDGMGLHGLWPNRDDDPKHRYGYCDLSEKQVGSDWCAPEIDVKSSIGDETFHGLSITMPGVKSCLYNHEWYAHGSCSGLSVDEYFATAALLTIRFWELESINELIHLNEGDTVSRDDIFDALEEDLGPNARGAAVLNCRYDKQSGVAYLSEIHLALDKKNLLDFPEQKSLSKFPPRKGRDGEMVQDEGNCPEEIQISK